MVFHLLAIFVKVVLPEDIRDLSNAVVEFLDVFFRDLQERKCSSLLGLVVGQGPDTVLDRELVVLSSHLRQDSHFEAAHREEQIGVVA